MSTEAYDVALKRWSDSGFSTWQGDLEVYSGSILDAQARSLASRKALAEKTKEFKKIPEAEKLSTFKDLLKSYQREIEDLSKRSKSAESLLLDACHRLGDVPDPIPILTTAKASLLDVQTLGGVEAERNQLKEEVADLKRAAQTSLLNGETSKKAQQDLRDLEKEMEETIKTRVGEREASFIAQADARAKKERQREQVLERQLNETRKALSSSKATIESLQARLLKAPAASQTVGEDHIPAGGSGEEVIYLERELAKANMRAAEAEKALATGKALPTEESTSATGKIHVAERRIGELEAENLSLHARISQAERTSRSSTGDAASSDTMRAQLSVSKKRVKELEDILHAQKDYATLKNELVILKSLEFSQQDLTEGGLDPNIGDVPAPPLLKSHSAGGIRNGDDDTPPSGDTRFGTLEVLILRKNRRLQDELSQLKTQSDITKAEYARVKTALVAAESQLERAKRLTLKLEGDVERLQVDSRPSSVEPASFSVAESNMESLSAMEVIPRSAPMSPSPSFSGFTGGPGNEASLIPILKGQRDRFKARNGELESELKKTTGKMQELGRKIESLQADNIQLYERIRFQQESSQQGSSLDPSNGRDRRDSTGTWTAISMDNTGRGPGGSRMAFRGGKSQPSILPSSIPHVDTLAADVVTDRYRSAYEDRLDPFSSFHRQEADRARRALNPFDRILLTLARTVLSTRVTRLSFLAYVCLLHILVVGTLFSASIANEPLEPIHS